MDDLIGIDMDRVEGTQVGQATGDCLGLRAEHRSRAEVLALYPDGGPHDFEAVDRTEHAFGETFEKGQASDDTAQFNLILDAGIEEPDTEACVPRIARAFHYWLHTDGRGAGGLTRAVLGHPDYLDDPIRVAAEVWEARKHPAPNGGVMRAAACGLLDPLDIPWTAGFAGIVCRLTHADPRCVISAITVAVAVARLVQRMDPRDVYANAAYEAVLPEPRAVISTTDLDALRLDEGLDLPLPRPKPPVGYTYKTLGVAGWTLGGIASGRITANDVLPTLQAIIRQGGDTDTNAAVAGAILGAAFGASAFPQHLRDGLRDRDAIAARCEKLHARYTYDWRKHT